MGVNGIHKIERYINVKTNNEAGYSLKHPASKLLIVPWITILKVKKVYFSTYG